MGALHRLIARCGTDQRGYQLVTVNYLGPCWEREEGTWVLRVPVGTRGARRAWRTFSGPSLERAARDALDALGL